MKKGLMTVCQISQIFLQPSWFFFVCVFELLDEDNYGPGSASFCRSCCSIPFFLWLSSYAHALRHHSCEQSTVKWPACREEDVTSHTACSNKYGYYTRQLVCINLKVVAQSMSSSPRTSVNPRQPLVFVPVSTGLYGLKPSHHFHIQETS